MFLRLATQKTRNILALSACELLVKSRLKSLRGTIMTLWLNKTLEESERSHLLKPLVTFIRFMTSQLRHKCSVSNWKRVYTGVWVVHMPCVHTRCKEETAHHSAPRVLFVNSDHSGKTITLKYKTKVVAVKRRKTRLNRNAQTLFLALLSTHAS